VSTPSSRTDRAYEYDLGYPGNKTDQKYLPSQVLRDSPEREYCLWADEEAQGWAALWKSSRRLVIDKRKEWVTALMCSFIVFTAKYKRLSKGLWSPYGGPSGLLCLCLCVAV